MKSQRIIITAEKAENKHRLTICLSLTRFDASQQGFVSKLYFMYFVPWVHSKVGLLLILE